MSTIQVGEGDNALYSNSGTVLFLQNGDVEFRSSLMKHDRVIFSSVFSEKCGTMQIMHFLFVTANTGELLHAARVSCFTARKSEMEKIPAWERAL